MDFWTPQKLKSDGQIQGLELFPAHLGRGFEAMALENPVFVMPGFKFQEGLAQLFPGIEILHLEQFVLENSDKARGHAAAFRGPDKSLGTGEARKDEPLLVVVRR